MNGKLLFNVVCFREAQRTLAQWIKLELITEMDTAKAALKMIVHVICEYAESYKEREEFFACMP